MNLRQRKKLRVGEFQEFVFEITVRFRQPMEDAALDAFMDGFIDLIESRHLIVGGLGGRLPLMETNGIVSAWRRSSPTNEDRQAVLNWLEKHVEVANAEAGDLIDGWYGWEDAP